LELLDTRIALVLSVVYLNLPIVVWLLRGFFMTIPKELDDAARVDGASRFGVFLRIALPLSLPGIAAASIFAFLHAWNDYLFPLVLTFSEKAITLPLASYNFTSDVSIIWNGLAASSILTCVPAIVFTVFFQKWLISGLTKGAVKG
jgi:multiple sugar transport system permease protein